MDKKIKLAQKIDFFQELSSIYKCSFSISSSLEHLSSGFAQEIKYQLKRGEQLSKILARYCFEKEVIFLIEAAEEHGCMAEALVSILDHYQHREKLKAKIIKDLIYPGITIVFALIILAGFCVFILPKFNNVYYELGLTQVHNSGDLSLKIIFGLSSLCFVTFVSYEKIKTILINKLTFIKDGYLVYFFTFLVIVAGTNQNPGGFIEKMAPGSLYPAALYKTAFYLKKGQNLSSALLQSGLIKQKYYQLLRQGEYVNNVYAVLKNITQQFTEEYFGNLEKIVMLIEPAVVIVVGLFIGFVSFMIISPLIQLTRSLI